MVTESIKPRVEQSAGIASHPRSILGGTTRRDDVSPRAVCSALNRLIVAGRNEVIALNAAVSMVNDAERRARLREQIARRLIFRGDLTAAVVALGGVPARTPSVVALLAMTARRVRRLLIGPHDGDAYAVCARATERTAAAYSKALALALPADVRFGVEHQAAEIESDRSELRRLRWGASLARLPGQGVRTTSEGADAPSHSEIDDQPALERWDEEGGATPNRPARSLLERRQTEVDHG